MSSTPALDLIDWAIRHQAGLFYLAMGLLGIYFVARVVLAIDEGVQKYRSIKARRLR